MVTSCILDDASQLMVADVVLIVLTCTDSACPVAEACHKPDTPQAWPWASSPSTQPAVNVIKLVFSIADEEVKEARVFVPHKYFQRSLTFANYYRAFLSRVPFRPTLLQQATGLFHKY